MKYSKEEVLQYVNEEDVKFIRLAFCDIFGNQKNVSIMPSELDRAFRSGIAIDGSALAGFNSLPHSDLIIHPDPATLSVLPWRPDHGKVVRMFCSITDSRKEKYGADTRAFLNTAVSMAEKAGVSVSIGTDMTFYLFKCDEHESSAGIPYDNGGYMDIAPLDRGENVRREICLYLEKMGITPVSSHHEEGPGQNIIKFRDSDPEKSADNTVTFKSVVSTVCSMCGLSADFSINPVEGMAKNKTKINICVKSKFGEDITCRFAAGIISHFREISLFLSTSESAYTDSDGLSHIRFFSGGRQDNKIEISLPYSQGNPYLSYALLIYAGLDGVESKPETVSKSDHLDSCEKQTLALPKNITEAKKAALDSDFIKKHITEEIANSYLF